MTDKILTRIPGLLLIICVLLEFFDINGTKLTDFFYGIAFAAGLAVLIMGRIQYPPAGK